MSNRLILPIDPKRPTGWALAEFLLCLFRDLVLGAGAGRRAWQSAGRHRSVSIARALVLAGALTVCGAAADQHFRALKVLLTALFG
jgi:hypothetical protein